MKFANMGSKLEFVENVFVNAHFDLYAVNGNSSPGLVFRNFPPMIIGLNGGIFTHAK